MRFVISAARPCGRPNCCRGAAEFTATAPRSHFSRLTHPHLQFSFLSYRHPTSYIPQHPSPPLPRFRLPCLKSSSSSSTRKSQSTVTSTLSPLTETSSHQASTNSSPNLTQTPPSLPLKYRRLSLRTPLPPSQFSAPNHSSAVHLQPSLRIRILRTTTPSRTIPAPSTAPDQSSVPPPLPTCLSTSISTFPRSP